MFCIIFLLLFIPVKVRDNFRGTGTRFPLRRINVSLLPGTQQTFCSQGASIYLDGTFQSGSESFRSFSPAAEIKNARDFMSVPPYVSKIRAHLA
jgi:hypothetical protein